MTHTTAVVDADHQRHAEVTPLYAGISMRATSWST
jgi:hypothetical protein